MQLKHVVVVLWLAWTCACTERDSRVVAGDYCLDRWSEGQRFFNITGCNLRAKLHGSTPDNGPLDGAVERLGWNDRYIVAWRRALAASDPNGWMILDAQRQSLEGPYSDEELDRRRQALPGIESVRIYDVEAAWEILLKEGRTPKWWLF